MCGSGRASSEHSVSDGVSLQLENGNAQLKLKVWQLWLTQLHICCTIGPHLLQGKEEALRTAFIEIDKDGSGHLDAEELAECLQLCGFRITKHQVIALSRLLDTDKSGAVDVKEFLHALNVSA